MGAAPSRTAAQSHEKLVNMKGTEKQIAWAEDIVREWSYQIEALVIPEEVPNDSENEDDFFYSEELMSTPVESIVALKFIFEKIKMMDDAEIIINHRNLKALGLIENVISASNPLLPMNILEKRLLDMFDDCDFDSAKKIIEFVKSK